jgi:hypothetical protein
VSPGKSELIRGFNFSKSGSNLAPIKNSRCTGQGTRASVIPFFLLLLNTSFCQLPALCAGKAIAIRKEPTQIARIETSPDLPWKHKQANTTWFFHCRPIITSLISRRQSLKQHVRITVVVTRIELALSMSIRIITPKRRSLALQAHEEGHKEICERIYSQAEAIAAASARRLPGMNISAYGDTVELAHRSADAVAARIFCRDYCSHTVSVANRVSAIYDTLTMHGKNRRMSSKIAVDKAFQRLNQPLEAQELDR